jgi:aryl-alcohol dehydrogenase-like predicted oxidoreductase
VTQTTHSTHTTHDDKLSLDTYRLLGRSGLRVSPLSLGAMTFGSAWGWGADEADTRKMIDVYLDRGGNFVDTASTYTKGESERLLGQIMGDRRDRIVLATKYSMSLDPTDPNGGGNGRKSLRRSVERSLRQLQTDYIDLLYLHVWDHTTPIEEVLRGLDDLVQAGKVLYIGLSDIPAWQAARMQTTADLRGWSPLVALQIEYSLIERTVERELIPMAAELGLGVIPWSPLGSGVLTGKYSRADLDVEVSTDPGAGGRRNVALANGSLTAHNLDVADVVVSVAEEVGRTPAQVALAWTLLNPAVTSPIVGARTVAQLEDNLGALDVVFDEGQRARLDEASAVVLGFPHDFMREGGMARRVVMGDKTVLPRR